MSEVPYGTIGRRDATGREWLPLGSHFYNEIRFGGCSDRAGRGQTGTDGHCEIKTNDLLSLAPAYLNSPVFSKVLLTFRLLQGRLSGRRRDANFGKHKNQNITK